MKYIIYLFCMGLFACQTNPSGNSQNKVDSHSIDSLHNSLISNFRQFRDAVYQKNIDKVESYFRFPVLNYQNEIWDLVYPDPQNVKPGFNPDKIIPFQETDFRKNFTKFFSEDFIQSILKIKSEELFKSGSSSTELFEVKGDGPGVFSMNAHFDKINAALTLELFYNRNIKDKEGNDVDGGESSIIYNFDVKENGRLVFKEIRMAG